MWPFKKKVKEVQEIPVKKDTITKFELVQTGSEKTEIERIEGYYLIRFLTHEDKVMEYRLTYNQTSRSVDSPRSYDKNIRYLMFEPLKNVIIEDSGQTFKVVEMNTYSSLRGVVFDKKQKDVIYTYQGYYLDKSNTPSPIEFIPTNPTVEIDGILWNVKAYISSTFVQTKLWQEEVELKEYELKYTVEEV